MAIPDVPSMKENRNNNATIVPADFYDRQARELLRLKALHYECILMRRTKGRLVAQRVDAGDLLAVGRPAMRLTESFPLEAVQSPR